MLKISLDFTSEPGVPESHVVTEQTPIKKFVEIEGVPYSEAEDDVKATLEVPPKPGTLE